MLQHLAALVEELAWLLDLPDEIRSDMSVFHRIDDVDTMPAHRFWSFASRLPFYDGAVRAMSRTALTPEPASPAQAAPVPTEQLEVWQMTPKPPPGSQVVSPGGALSMLASYGSQHANYSRAPLA